MEIIEQLQSRSAKFFWSPKIELCQIEGRGNSVVCRESLDQNEVIINIPADLLINISTISEPQNEELSTQEILARELIRRKHETGDLWVESLPQSFDTMPMSWPESSAQALPARYRSRVQEQKREVAEFVSKCQLPHEEAEWGWKAVNTRCVYWEHGGMTLAPALDYLNHTCDPSGSSALRVQPSPHGISVRTQSKYNRGDELTFCYGPHENAFLLVEYGFMVDENPWNFIDITPELDPLVSHQQSWLAEHGYWGDWTIGNDGHPSFRVDVALAALQAPNTRLLDALIAGYDDGSRYSAKSRLVLEDIVTKLQQKLARERGNTALREELKCLLKEYLDILSKFMDTK